MSKNIRWTSKQMRDKKLVETKDGFVPIDSVTAKGKVSKLPNLLEQLNTIEPAVKSFLVSKEQKPNKIRNAKKIEANGITFDSRLEQYLYEQLQGAGVTFEFQKVYILQNKFRYRGEAIRDIRIIFDFWLPKHNMLLDSKGWQLADNKLKHKLLKYRLAKHYEKNDLGEPPEILMPSTKKAINELILKLKHG